MTEVAITVPKDVSHLIEFHQRLVKFCVELGPFLVDKNTKYGDTTEKTAECMKIWFPDGIPADRYLDAFFMEMVCNKLGRVAANNDPGGEKPWKDAAGYCVLAHEKTEEK